MQISPDTHAGAKFWLDVADKAIKTIALLIGAGWTYLNYLRGRTFKNRLEVEATGELFERAGAHYLLATCRLKNVGLSEFPIQQRGTACTVYALTDADMHPSKPVDIFEIFQEHDWIEPAEVISHPELVPLPFYGSNLVGILLHVRVVSRGIEWGGSCIVKIGDPATQAASPETSAEVNVWESLIS